MSARPEACRMKKFFKPGMRSTSPRPMSRTARMGADVVREEPVQDVGGHPHLEGVEAAPALVALQDVRARRNRCRACRPRPRLRPGPRHP